MLNTKESKLEQEIINHLVNHNHYELADNHDYNKEFAVDETRLFRFLQSTQPEAFNNLGLNTSQSKKLQFIHKLSNEISKNGIINILRNGFNFYPEYLTLFYMTPSQNNSHAKILHSKNIFSVIRQLRYSQTSKHSALDLCLFINGLPIITCELKNSFTHQYTQDAVNQYKNDRKPHELLFSFKRCIVHFALDDMTIQFCTKLEGSNSIFLPFNKGFNNGAGNPPNQNGIMTDYLWKDIFSKTKLSRIIENYVHIILEKQIWPRYHQFDCVEKLIDDVKTNGVGKKYLIQHSAGSGKSNSIAWLALQLTELEENGRPLLDSVFVVTDRKLLDKQIRDTIKNFTQQKNILAWASNSKDLATAIQNGKKIIITTIEKFPYVIENIGTHHKNKKLAVIIDEAHSGQNGENAKYMNIVLSGNQIHDINDLVEGRKLLTNASYFAFTATPKNKTEEMFGTPYEEKGIIKHKPFHVYTMKQAVQEGFILDVLANYTTIQSWYRIMKTVEEDKMFDKKRALKKLHAFVEGNHDVIAKKAQIITEHFHEHVIRKRKIKGKARAMIVTESIAECVEYYHAVNKCFSEINSPYKIIIAFSGEYNGHTSAYFNSFPDSEITKRFINDPYRILVVADMFQTGFDEPLLQTMYIDKKLSDIAAVQTISRLNRTYPGKDNVFVIDFANDIQVISESFSKFYRTTILSGETDPNKLHDLISIMNNSRIYDKNDIDKVTDIFLNSEEREEIDYILDKCAYSFCGLNLDEQIKFKSAAKSFVRTYSFLGAILPYGDVECEKLSIFLKLLLSKLPALTDEDFFSSEGILKAVDLDSYRCEAKEAIAIKLEDEGKEILPVPGIGVMKESETEIKYLSEIINEFNNKFGHIKWSDIDKVRKKIESLPEIVIQDKRYKNAVKNSDSQEARVESERVLQNAMLSIEADDMELLKQFSENEEFKKWLSDMIFNLTYFHENVNFMNSDRKII